MVRRDHGRGGHARILRGRARAGSGHAGQQDRRLVRPVDPGRPGAGLGAVGAPARAPCGAVPRRQLPARADAALRRGPDQPGPPPPDELVALPRARLPAVPPLPEPAVHDLGRLRDVPQPRHRLPLVPVPAPGSVAHRRLLERPALRAEPLDGRVGGGGRTVPRLGRRHRLRDQGLRVGRLRRVDAAVGLVDAPAGVGLHLPGPVRTARCVLRRALHHADGGAALRDRVPGLRAARRVALHCAFGPLAATRARGGARRGGRVGVGLGHRPRAPAVPLGGAQSDPRRHPARERLRRPADAVVAGHRQPLRQRPLSGRVPRLLAHRHRARRRGDRRLHCRAGARWWPVAPSSSCGWSR